MTKSKDDKRKYKRFNTEIEVYFDFAYDLETKIDFELLDKVKEERLSQKYKAVSRNISVEGLSFVSHQKLKPGDYLHMELYLPSAKEAIHMKGEVKWCKNIPASFEQYGLSGQAEDPVFQIGVYLISVNNQLVKKSIHYDEEYQVHWSIVLIIFDGLIN